MHSILPLSVLPCALDHPVGGAAQKLPSANIGVMCVTPGWRAVAQCDHGTAVFINHMFIQRWPWIHTPKCNTLAAPSAHSDAALQLALHRHRGHHSPFAIAPSLSAWNALTFQTGSEDGGHSIQLGSGSECQDVLLELIN